jgi:hypothetical protein
MTKEDLVALCKHIHTRQEEHGVADAFKFCRYEFKNKMAAACYGTRVDEDRAEIKARKEKEARAAGRRGKTSGRKGKEAAGGGSDTTVTRNDPADSDCSVPSDPPPTRASSTAVGPAASDRSSVPSDPPPTPEMARRSLLKDPRPKPSITSTRRLRSHDTLDTPTPRLTRGSTRGSKGKGRGE